MKDLKHALLIEYLLMLMYKPISLTFMSVSFFIE